MSRVVNSVCQGFEKSQRTFDERMKHRMELKEWGAWLTRCVVALFVLFSAAGHAIAGHALGGEVLYTHLGNNQYQITVIFYRDCNPPNNLSGNNLDQSILLGIFEGSSTYTLVDVPLTQSSTTPVPTVLENPCGVLPNELCMQRLEYTTVQTLPPSSVGYDLVFQRCCRNAGIINVSQSDEVGITLTTQIPPNITNANPNSSPQFVNYPPAAICRNFAFFMDHSATDADGDSLAYSFCTPINGGTPFDPAPTPQPAFTFTNIPYNGGFTALDPITDNPNFQIDPITGQITGTPTQVGLFVIGVCVSEYRDGELLSTVMRDFQFNVVNCDPNIISAVQPQTAAQLCVGETMTFDNNSVNGQFFEWNFGVAGTVSDVSTDFEPTYTFPDTGVYEVTLIANPGWPCADTSSQTFYVYEPIEPTVVIEDYMCSENTSYFAFDAQGAFNAATELDWTFVGGTPGTANVESPQWIHFNNAESIEVNLTASHFGCSASTTFIWDAPPWPQASIEDQTSFCQGFTFDFTNNSVDADSYSWNFGTGNPADVSTGTSPTFTYPSDGVYSVTLIASADYTCPDTAIAAVEIFPLIDPTFPPLTPECFSTNNFSVSVIASNIPETTYAWDFGGTVVSADISGGTVNNLIYASPGTYDITVTATANGCDVEHTETVWVIEDPTINFQAGPLSGCPPHLVSFTNLSTTETATTYLWHFGDGGTSPAANPTHVYEVAGSFPVTLEMSTGGFCQQELTLQVQDYVNIYAPPDAGFDLAPNTVDILSPTVQVTSFASADSDCYYNFGDGGSMEACTGTYTFSNGGLFTVTQTVVNPAGCASTATGQVAVNGTVFYAPTAFSPNNDGMNDVWLPSVLGVTDYRCEIYNRWGEKIWETQEAGTPWLGQVHNGDHYAPDGLYHFRIWFEDQLRMPTEHAGLITLIR